MERRLQRTRLNLGAGRIHGKPKQDQAACVLYLGTGGCGSYRGMEGRREVREEQRGSRRQEEGTWWPVQESHGTWGFLQPEGGAGTKVDSLGKMGILGFPASPGP